MTEVLVDYHHKVGWGVAHCSYNRLRPATVRGWEHGRATRDLAMVLERFVDTAPRLPRQYRDEIGGQIQHMRAGLPFDLRASGTTGTPMHPDAQRPVRHPRS